MSLPALSDPRVPWFARMKRAPLTVIDDPPTLIHPRPAERLRWVHPGRELTPVERAERMLAWGVIPRDPPNVCAQRRTVLAEALDGFTPPRRSRSR